MKNSEIIEEFKKSWEFSRSMTTEFLKELPEDKWDYSPHKKYSAICKQLRHMVWVSGLYNEALETGEMRDCETKKEHYSGDLSKTEILKGFKDQEQKLSKILEKLKSTDLDTHKVKAFGLEMGFVEFTHVMIQHESTHQGLWSFYATFGGFETPKSWQQNWGI